MYVAWRFILLLFLSAGKSDEIGTGSQKHVSEMARLESVCAGLNRQIINVPMDGNCMFSALAVHLPQYHAADDPASRIRAELVAYLRNQHNIVRNVIK